VSQPRLKVNEIFFSIQGESSMAGTPCVFVRLAFCNLRCRWCDSAHAFHEGDEMTLDEVMGKVAGYPCRVVEITGGEPLLQEAVLPLMARLCDAGYEVLLETSGSLDIGRVDPRVRRIVDIKCPSSGMAARNRWRNLELLTGQDEVKFVLADRADYAWARSVVEQHRLAEKCTVLMGPVFGELDNQRLAQWILADGLPVRYQLQLHKYVWDPAARGV
jgi:7-carboxy-7-deazaguanine synthase